MKASRSNSSLLLKKLEDAKSKIEKKIQLLKRQEGGQQAQGLHTHREKHNQEPIETKQRPSGVPCLSQVHSASNLKHPQKSSSKKPKGVLPLPPAPNSHRLMPILKSSRSQLKSKDAVKRKEVKTDMSEQVKIVQQLSHYKSEQQLKLKLPRPTKDVQQFKTIASIKSKVKPDLGSKKQKQQPKKVQEPETQSNDSSTWDDAVLNQVLRKLVYKHGGQTLEQYLETRPWLQNSKWLKNDPKSEVKVEPPVISSLVAQPSANAPSSIPIMLLPERQMKSLQIANMNQQSKSMLSSQEQLSSRREACQLPLQSARGHKQIKQEQPKQGQKLSKANLEILSKMIPKPKQPEQERVVLLDCESELETFGGFNPWKIMQSEDNRPRQILRHSEERLPTSRSHSASTCRRAQITGRNLAAESQGGVIVNVSPLGRDSLENKSICESSRPQVSKRYDLPCQITNRLTKNQQKQSLERPRSILKSSNKGQKDAKSQSRPPTSHSAAKETRIKQAPRPANDNKTKHPQPAALRNNQVLKQQQFLVTFNQGASQPKPPTQKTSALENHSKVVFTERGSIENQDPNRQKEMVAFSPKVLATQRSKANPPLILEKKRSKSPIVRAMREYKQELVLRSKSVQPVRHTPAVIDQNLSYQARERPKSSQKQRPKHFPEPKFVIPNYQLPLQLIPVQTSSGNQEVVHPCRETNQTRRPNHSPPAISENPFDVIVSESPPFKHKYGVLQMKNQSVNSSSKKPKPVFKPAGIAKVKSPSASPSVCSHGIRQSKCSRSIRSRSPEQRADELGLGIFEFVPMTHRQKQDDRKPEKPKEQKKQMSRAEKIQHQRLTQQRAKHALDLLRQRKSELSVEKPRKPTPLRINIRKNSPSKTRSKSKQKSIKKRSKSKKKSKDVKKSQLVPKVIELKPKVTRSSLKQLAMRLLDLSNQDSKQEYKLIKRKQLPLEPVLLVAKDLSVNEDRPLQQHCHRISQEIPSPYQNSFIEKPEPTFGQQQKAPNALPSDFQSFAIPAGPNTSMERLNQSNMSISCHENSAQPTFELSVQKQQAQQVLTASTVIQRWFRQHLAKKKIQISAEAGPYARRRRHYDERQNSSIRDSEYQTQHQLKDLVNTSTKGKNGKNQMLFETSQKSLLVSIQRSRRILSQVDSSVGVDPSSMNQNGSDFVTVQVKDNELEEDGMSPSVIKTLGSKQSPISDQSQDQISINQIELQKDFEVESLNDFLKDLQTDELDDKHRVQYVSSLKSVEVHDVLKHVRDIHQEMLKKHNLDQMPDDESDRDDDIYGNEEIVQTPVSVVMSGGAQADGSPNNSIDERPDQISYVQTSQCLITNNSAELKMKSEPECQSEASPSPNRKQDDQSGELKQSEVEREESQSEEPVEMVDKVMKNLDMPMQMNSKHRKADSAPHRLATARSLPSNDHETAKQTSSNEKDDLFFQYLAILPAIKTSEDPSQPHREHTEQSIKEEQGLVPNKPKHFKPELYHTQWNQLDLPACLDAYHSDELPLSSQRNTRNKVADRYHTINLLRNEKWPRGLQSQSSQQELTLKDFKQPAYRGNKPPPKFYFPLRPKSTKALYHSSNSRADPTPRSSFFHETIKIINKVNEHVRVIKQNLRPIQDPDSSSLNTTQKKAVALKFTQLEAIDMPSSSAKRRKEPGHDEQSEDHKSVLQGRYHHQLLQDSACESEAEQAENSGPQQTQSKTSVGELAAYAGDIQYSANHEYNTVETRQSKSNDGRIEEASASEFKTEKYEMNDARVKLEKGSQDQHDQITFEDQNPKQAPSSSNIDKLKGDQIDSSPDEGGERNGDQKSPTSISKILIPCVQNLPFKSTSFEQQNVAENSLATGTAVLDHKLSEGEQAPKHPPPLNNAALQAQKDGIPIQISAKQLEIQQELESLQKAFDSGDTSKQQQPNELIAGIDTSLETVDSYIEDIFAQIRDRAPQFLNAFLTPIYKDPHEQLQLNQKAQLEYQLNGTLAGAPAGLLDDFQFNNSLVCILNVQLYLTLEKERESVIKEAIEQIKQQSEEEINEEELTEMISEADHIHNKAIFDAVNEAMNSIRPYGLEGEPMPWSHRPRKNVFAQIQDNIESVHRVLGRVLHQVKHKVLCWASTYAGQIQGSYASNRSFNSNRLQQIEQGAFGKLANNISEREIEQIIQQEILDSDDKDWMGLNENLFTQVKLELADRLTDHLIQETIGVLNGIQRI